MHENNPVVRIPFHGDELLTFDVNGKPHVALRPVIEGLGLSYRAQLRKLERRSWAVVAPKATTGKDGKTYKMATVDVRTLVMLLATVDENRVAEHVRPKLIAYQSEVADVIETYWTRGFAVNPRSAGIYEPITYTWDEVVAVMRQDWGQYISVVALTRMLRTAGVLKQNGAPRKVHAHMFWFTGSHWAIHPHAVPFLLRKADDVGRELREFRFLQMRLELDGVASGEIA